MVFEGLHYLQSQCIRLSVEQSNKLKFYCQMQVWNSYTDSGFVTSYFIFTSFTQPDKARERFFLLMIGAKHWMKLNEIK